ncbi:hypothetical protein HDU96_010642 [Phlyctochytrium bullatum]|nr:hypothetical protein HDU96_010642 [Phlyctochytrium bullatum]
MPGSKVIKVLLLEGVNKTGVNILKNAGFEVEYFAKALPEDQLKEKIKDVHAVGIRSKTMLTADVLKEAKELLVIGCFCIGTNQVDIEYATSRGNALNCHEIKGKTLGIVGYGHIGSQLSVLADSFGMSVIFYDILQTMPLGTAKPTASLADMLRQADIVTLHVPETPETKNMIGEKEIALMKKGSYLINASRGTVVDIPSLSAALKSGHLAGAAVDVFPVEPFTNGKNFSTELQGCHNTVLTPHIGGSTEEAQSAIGVEVGSALTKFLQTGSTFGAVNFPEVDLRAPGGKKKFVRVLNVHQNVPGVLKQINKILSDFNIEKQICDSKGPIGYLVADLDAEGSGDLEAITSSINSMSGYWFWKLLAYAGLVVLAFFIPNPFFVGWGLYINIPAAVLFILIQIVLLIDFSYSFSESLLEQWETTEDKKYLAFLLVMTFGAFGGCIALSGIMYAWFGGFSCQLNQFFITFNIILSLVVAVVSIAPQVQELNPKSGLAQSAMVVAYATYLVASAISSEPEGDGDTPNICNPLNESGKTRTTTIVLGTIFTFLALAYSTSSAATSALTSDDSSTALLGNDRNANTLQMEEDGEGPVDDEQDGVQYNYSFFHLIFALGSCYLSQLITNWDTVTFEKGKDTAIVGKGWGAVWVKVVSSWVVLLLYGYA